MARTITFDTQLKAKDRWERLFKGRPGCELAINTGRGYDEDEDLPCNEIIVTDEIGRAWDRGLDAAQALPRSMPDRGAQQLKVIEKELDAVAPRSR